MDISTINNLNPELENLSNIIEHLIYNCSNFASQKTHQDEGLVIAVEGEYGTGKSTFLNFFADIVQNPKNGRPKNLIYSYLPEVITDGFTTKSGLKIDKENCKKTVLIKYNAWEHDYFEDPLISLIAQVCNQLPKINEILLKDVKDSAKSVLKAAANIITKPIVQGFNAIQADHEEKKFTPELGLFADLENAKVKFKDSLTKFKTNDNEDLLKVILVDELDRCKPTFAVKLLEAIKHFFNIENAVFILAISKEQFISTIRAVYGETFDAQKYLSRFFDFELRLPQSKEFYQNLLKNSYAESNHKALLFEITEILQLKPREQLRFYKITRFAKTFKNWNSPYHYLMLGLYIKDTSNVDKMLSFFDDLNLQTLDTIDMFHKFIKTLAAVKDIALIEETKEVYSAFLDLFILSSANSTKRRVIPEYVEKTPALKAKLCILNNSQAKHLTGDDKIDVLQETLKQLISNIIYFH